MMNTVENPTCTKPMLGVVLLEDCLTTMGKLTDNYVDLIITSPPYNKAGYEGFIRKDTKKIVGAKAETLSMAVKRKQILCPKPNIRNNK